MSTRYKPRPKAASEGERNWRRAFLDSVSWQQAVEGVVMHLQRVNRMKHGVWYHSPRDWYSAPFR